jgi:hypothetical protein
MSEQMNPGEGWRLLRPDEAVREGDEFFYQARNKWIRVSYFGNCVGLLNTYRRRIPAKPEAIKIRHTLIKCNSFNDVMRATNQDVSLLVGSAAEARQLADWLTRYADWREAQGEAK